MTAQLEVGNDSNNTRDAYLRIAKTFIKYYRRPAKELGEHEVRTYLLNRLEKVEPATVALDLAALKRFDLAWLKIQRNFIRDMTTAPDDLAVTEAIVAVACALGLRIVAEGVEDPDQLDLLRAIGCHVIQGFLFSRPQPADRARVLIEQGKIELGTDVL